MLLENFRHVKSTLRSDRLFTLLGLASDGHKVAFEPDYVVPFESVVLRSARVFVGQCMGMHLRYLAGLEDSLGASWISDWTVPRNVGLVSRQQSSAILAKMSYSLAGMRWDVIKTTSAS